MPDETRFSEAAFYQLERIERAAGELRTQMREADEYLLMAHAQVSDLIQRQGPGVPAMLFVNDMPQTVGVSYGWHEGVFVLTVTHRGGDFQHAVAPKQDLEVQVTPE